MEWQNGTKQSSGAEIISKIMAPGFGNAMQVADAFLIFKSKESQRQVSMAQQQNSLDELPVTG